MKAFSYVNPANERDAIRALSGEPEKVMPLAGGQDLLARLKDYIAQPDRIVNVKGALDATITAMLRKLPAPIRMRASPGAVSHTFGSSRTPSPTSSRPA